MSDTVVGLLAVRREGLGSNGSARLWKLKLVFVYIKDQKAAPLDL